MLRLVQALVFALVASFGMASGASAFGAKTALRGIWDHGGDRVGAFDLEACGRRQQNRAFTTVIASECCHVARGGPQILRSVGAAANRVVNFGTRQLQAKFKHAVDFGVSGPWNRGAAEAFETALQSHVDDAATMIIKGTYRGQDVVHFLNPSTGLNVIKGAADDAFISGWRLNAAQLENVLTRGSL